MLVVCLQHVDLALPQEMIDGVEQFKTFYEVTTKHRKLGWVYALGTCHVKANFDAKPIELILGTFQATLLLLFNTGKVQFMLRSGVVIMYYLMFSNVTSLLCAHDHTFNLVLTMLAPGEFQNPAEHLACRMELNMHSCLTWPALADSRADALCLGVLA